MYPDVETSTTTAMIVDGVAPKQMYVDPFDISSILLKLTCLLAVDFAFLLKFEWICM